MWTGFNKFKAALTSSVKKQSGLDFSRRLENLTRRRNHKIDSYLHRATAMIADVLKSENISSLVIGLNPDWKNEVELGKRNNQNFVGIPFRKFISMLEYKLRLLGIEVRVMEESYTSQSSFLDLDEIPTYGKKPEGWKSSGRRIHRGLFKSKLGRIINADVNGSYNILRKEFPNAFSISFANLNLVCLYLTMLRETMRGRIRLLSVGERMVRKMNPKKRV